MQDVCSPKLIRRRRNVLVVFALLAGTVVVAHAAATAASADAQWTTLDAILAAKTVDSDADRTGFLIQREQRARRYREQGLAFYNAFPGDPRRWQWLLTTFRSAPAYWINQDPNAWSPAEGMPLDKKIDLAAQHRWERLLHDKLAPEFLNSPQVKSGQRAAWRIAEMNRIWDSTSALVDSRTVDPRKVDEFVQALLAYAAEPAVKEKDGLIKASQSRLHTLSISSGLDVKSQWAVARAFASSPNKQLQTQGQAMQRILELTQQPLMLQVTTLDNQPVDVAAWRGRVVLVDFWSTSCSSCIEEMPKIKEVYQRYHDQGFEVLSVCLDTEENRGKVATILKKVAAPWPAAFESQRTSPLMARFGFTYVPVYFLLNRDGLLVTTDVRDNRLEPAVRRLLEMRPAGWSAYPLTTHPLRSQADASDRQAAESGGCCGGIYTGSFPSVRSTAPAPGVTSGD